MAARDIEDGTRLLGWRIGSRPRLQLQCVCACGVWLPVGGSRGTTAGGKGTDRKKCAVNGVVQEGAGSCAAKVK